MSEQGGGIMEQYSGPEGWGGADGGSLGGGGFSGRVNKLMPGARLKVPLGELVSQIVVEHEGVLEALADATDLSVPVEGALRIKDWEKALNDDSTRQFTDPKRALVEAVLNGSDTIARRVQEDNGVVNEQVKVEVGEGRFLVRDFGEGIDIERMQKLLIPKITDNGGGRLEEVVGQFGVGFYSLVGLLKEKGDNLVVRTTDGKGEGYRVSISKNFEDSEYPDGRLAVVVMKMDRKKHGAFFDRVRGRGTEVELKSKSVVGGDFEEYLERHLRYKQGAEIEVNGRQVNDLEGFREINVREEDTEGKLRWLESVERGSKGKVMLTVAGVVVEEFEVEGSQVARETVIYLPRTTNLTTSRDRVEVGESVANWIKNLIDDVVKETQKPVPGEIAARLSTIKPVVLALQQRNRSVKRSMDMKRKLEGVVESWIRQESRKGVLILPNSSEIGALEVDNGVVFIDSDLLPKEMELGVGGVFEKVVKVNPDAKVRVYQAPFRDRERVMVVAGRFVFLNQELDLDDVAVRAGLNQLFKVYDLGLGQSGVEHRLDLSLPLIQKTGDASLIDDMEEKGGPDVRHGGGGGRRENYSSELASFLDRQQAVEWSPMLKCRFLVDGKECEVLVGREEVPDLSNIFYYGVRLSQSGDGRSDGGKSFREQIARQLQTPKWRLTWWGRRLGADRIGVDRLKYLSYRVEYAPQSVAELRGNWVRDITRRVVLDMSRIGGETDFWKSLVEENGFYQELVKAMVMSEDEFKAWMRSELGADEAGEQRLRNLIKGYTDQFPHMMENWINNEYTKADADIGKQKILAITGLALRGRGWLRGLLVSFSDDDLLGQVCQGGDLHNFWSWAISGGYTRNNQDSVNVLAGYNMNCVNPTQIFDSPVVFWAMGRGMQQFDNSDDRIRFLRYVIESGDVVNQVNELVRRIIGKKEIGGFWPPEEIIHVMQFFGNKSERLDLFEKNMLSMRKCADNPQFGDLFGSGGDSIFLNLSDHVSLEKLMVGSVKEENLAALKDYYIEKGVEDSAIKGLMLNFLVPYAHFDTSVFRGVMELIYDLKDYFSQDDFVRHLGSEFGQPRRQMMTEVVGMYLLIQDEDMVRRRVEMLHDLPVVWVKYYWEFLSEMTKLKSGEVVGENQTQLVKEVEIRLLEVFGRLKEMDVDDGHVVLSDVCSVIRGKRGVGEIDHKAKPYAKFLLGGGTIRMVDLRFEDFETHERGYVVKASDLVGVYLGSEEIEDVNSIEALSGLVGEQQIRKMTQKLAERRVLHAVNYKASEPFIWLRELVQNAYNVSRSDEVEKRVELSAEMLRDGLLIKVRDFGGLGFSDIINGLLIPQSTRWKTEESMGYFGHGFFTVFKDADLVTVRSGTGGGEVNVVMVTPQRDPKTGEVVDLEYDFKTEAGDFEGTEIGWARKTEFPDLEIDRAKASLETFAGLMPPDKLEVVWQDELVNRHLPVLSEFEVGEGVGRIYAAPGQNVVTKEGLFVEDLGNKYWSRLPGSVCQVLKRHGIVLDLPGDILVVDTRAGIVDEEKVLKEMENGWRKAALEATIGLFTEGKVGLDRMPYDFFSEMERYAFTVDHQILEDVAALVGGEKIDWEPYLEEESRAFKLLCSLPMFEYGGEKLSILDVAVRSRDDDGILELVPDGLRRRIELKRDEVRLLRREKENMFEHFGLQEVRQPVWTSELPEAAQILRAWDGVFGQLLRPVVEDVGKQIVGAYYSAPNETVASANVRMSRVRWNVPVLEQELLVLGKMCRGEMLGEDEEGLVWGRLLGTGSHEYRHIEEGLEFLTHNVDFYRGQRRILELMMANLDREAVLRDLRQEYGDVPQQNVQELVEMLVNRG